ncbi:MAG: hypothetical protein VX829_00735 [Pseudomonadota bacterium]|uniref:Uncharacterized protein n=2 Tax=Methylophaga thalassica TaxID=40223 RepID=A0ABQ5TX86_9GAMM|nr:MULTISPECIES: hypothetical protein [Methylophaga]MEC9411181.1 hypothetical protein [Pseudomonadota bacterium]GLQ00803.1 hypothetical protein GCM10007891_26560 [Methylophaga thalassica]
MMNLQYKALFLTVPFFLASLLMFVSKANADTDVRAVTKPSVNRFTSLNPEKSSSLTLSPSGCVRTTETVTLSGTVDSQEKKWLLKSGDDWLPIETMAINNKQILLTLPATQLSAGQSYPLFAVEGKHQIDSGLSITICPAFSQLPLLPAPTPKTD